MSKFTHLHVHSHYSLLDGLPKIPQLVAAALERKMDALALTDHGVMYGAVKFYQAARAAGLKPIIGQEAYIAARSYKQKNAQIDRKSYHLTLLVKNKAGYQNLIQLTSKAHLEGFYYRPRIDRELLKKHSQGLICLSGCLQGEIPQAIAAGNLEKAEKLIAQYKAIFAPGDFYLELQHHPNLPQQAKVNEFLIKASSKFKLPLVATNDVHYLKPQDAEAQEVLMAIQTKKKLQDANRMSYRDIDLSLRPPSQMEKPFSKIPQALEATQEIAKKCQFQLELGQNKMPSFPLPQGKTSMELLRKLCEKGLKARFGTTSVSKSIRQRLNRELDIIEKTNFPAYFLIVQDVVNWAKKQGIVVGPGRGSAAGSLVAYLLNITNIDPLKYNLLFERFLIEDRIEPPDIDIDFADHRRDEVINYITRRYGSQYVAQIITFGTMGARAVVRDVGRALGYQYGYCDRLAKLIPFGSKLKDAYENVAEFRNAYETDPKARKLIDLSFQLEDGARHASTHAAGVVITPEPLTEYLPLQHASQGDKTVVTQYDMYDAVALGLLKLDILGLRNLSIIEETLDLVNKRHSQNLKVDNIPLDNKKTFELLKTSNTIGIFQLESEGMRHYLKELEPETIEDIIAMVSLYRPGPMELIPEFIARKQGRKPIKYLHPALEPILKETYGVAVYQEQVLKMAMDLADFSPTEADVLRKAVGKKIKKLLDQQTKKFIAGCIKKGLPEKVAKKLGDQLGPFARYAFNRAHGTSYAVIALQTAFLKANFTIEFYTALLNSRQETIEKLAFFIDDAYRNGIKVLPPSINFSGRRFQPTSDNTIRFGLGAIKNVGANLVEELVRERRQNGAYKDMQDLISRIRTKDLNKKSLEALIKAGALDELEERGLLLANLENIVKTAADLKKNAASKQETLFTRVEGLDFKASLTLEPAEPAPARQKLIWEKELLGLYISGNPLDEHRQRLQQETLAIAQLNDEHQSKRVKIGGTIEETKKITTKNGHPMLFVKVRDLTDTAEIVVFPRILEENPRVWQKGAVALLECRVQKRNGEISLICEKAEPL